MPFQFTCDTHPDWSAEVFDDVAAHRATHGPHKTEVRFVTQAEAQGAPLRRIGYCEPCGRSHDYPLHAA